MNKKKLIRPITIILTGIILGGFYYASEMNKQQSIERQQQLNLNQKQVEIQKNIDQQRLESRILSEERLQMKIEKVECVQDAKQSAIDYEKKLCVGGNTKCFGYVYGTYTPLAYQNFYKSCLEGKGLE